LPFHGSKMKLVEMAFRIIISAPVNDKSKLKEFEVRAIEYGATAVVRQPESD
jgi:hypothetical protein